MIKSNKLRKIIIFGMGIVLTLGLYGCSAQESNGIKTNEPTGESEVEEIVTEEKAIEETVTEETDNSDNEIQDSDSESNLPDLPITQYTITNNFENVSMAIKDNTVSPVELTLVLENNSDAHCIYGQYFIVEKNIEGAWYQVPTIIDNYGFDDIGYELLPDTSEEWSVNWEWLYGSLDEGDYRIVKNILDFRETGDYDEYYLSAEFTIKKGE